MELRGYLYTPTALPRGK